MSLRSTKVAQVPFISKNSGLTDIQEEKKRQALLDEFHTLCPHSRGLKASELGTRIELNDGGAVLEFHLHETPQISLDLVNRTPIEPIGVNNDMFANDVTLVTREIHQCRQLIRTIVSPAISLEALRERSLLGDQIRFIRRRLRKRDVFYLPSTTSLVIAIPRFTQRFAGPAVTVRMRGTVTALFKRAVELTDAEMVGGIPDQLAGVKLPARILMSRASTQKNPNLVNAFAIKLDSNQTIDLVVGVNLDAVNGRPISLRFQRFPETT